MKKKRKVYPLHDLFFKDIYKNTRYSSDLFKLILSKAERDMLDFSTLRLQVNTFVDKTWTEKRTDLLFLVHLKNSSQKAGLLFLIEHKSFKTTEAMLQLLNYQTGIYNKTKVPTVPVLVYHGQAKWTGPLTWQEHLKGFSDERLKQAFGKNVINFKPRMLNIQALDVKNKALGLTTYPILYILKKIWELSPEVLGDFFKMCQPLPVDEREIFIRKAVNYINQYDSRFTWNVIRDIENKVIQQPEERVMERLKSAVEIATERGWQAGRQEGRQEGMQQERQQVILNMLKKNAEISFISEVTGLSPEEIKKLQQED